MKGKINPLYVDITISDLLSHKGKTQPFEDDRSKEWRGLEFNKVSSFQQFAKYALNLPVYTSKESDTYSNGGYILAAYMMEKVTRIQWDTLRGTILDTLNMKTHSLFPAQLKANETNGHKKWALANKYRSIPIKDEFVVPPYFQPAGHLSISVEQYSRFIQMNLRGLLGMDNYVSSETYHYLHYGIQNYAMGWYNGTIGNTTSKFSYHGGSLGTYSSMAFISADDRLAIVILINAGGKNADKMRSDLREALWNQYRIK